MNLSPQNYWLSPQALYIERNALGNPDYIQANCVSNAYILVFVKGVIDYDEGHNYQRWKLQASPTIFTTHTAKYVYAAIPYADKSKPAQVVFPSESIDIYGNNQAGEHVGVEGYYYIFLQGILSSSGENGNLNRDWEQRIDTGYLDSNQALDAGANDTEWYSYSTVDQITTFLKDLTMKAGTKFRELFVKAVTIVSGGSITFADGGGSLKGIADDSTSSTSNEHIVTPAYTNGKYLSKKEDDIAEGNIAFKKDVDVFGNIIAETNAFIKGDLQVGSHDAQSRAAIYGDMTIGEYTPGMSGGYLDLYANAELESLTLRSFLQVPELRYNRTTITVGNKWQTAGAGIVEKVWTVDSFPEGATIPEELSSGYLGIAKLKLEDGEIGAIAVDDKCQGVYHFSNKVNDISTTDSHDGNFHFAGFTTIYFVIKEIYTDRTLPSFLKRELEKEKISLQENQYFLYELRAATCSHLLPEDRNRWTDASHPQEALHFACYSNETDGTRQASRLTTTTYQLHLAGMTDWTYTQDNIQVIVGWLDGFSMLRDVWDSQHKELIQVVKEFHGEGIAIGNIYMWGNIDQFDRAPSLIMQQLYYNYSIDQQTPEGIVLSPDHSSFDTNGWQTDPINPSASNRYVWQQWLYGYADGTYEVGEPYLSAIDSSVCMAYVDKPVVSVGVSDWYDPENPDNVEFTVVAHITVGGYIAPIASATARYEGELCESMQYEVDYDDSRSHATIHVTLVGFVGTQVNGIAPDDAYVTIHLSVLSNLPDIEMLSADTVVTLSENRRGEAGEAGKGYKGAKPLMYKWSDIKDDESLIVYSGDADNEEFYAIILDDTDISGETQYYTPRITHTIHSGEQLTDNTLWRKANKMSFTATDLFFAKRAYIKNLGVNNVLLTDGTEDGLYGGMCLPDPLDPQQTESLGDIRLWLGHKSPQQANFSVDLNGEITTTLVRRRMEFWDFPVTMSDPDYNFSYYLKKYFPSYIRVSAHFDDGLDRADSSPGGYDVITQQEPRKVIVLPYAGDVLGKEVEIVAPNGFVGAYKRSVIGISALTGAGQIPVVLTKNTDKIYFPWDWGDMDPVEDKGFKGLDYAVAEGNDGYFRSMTGQWRSLILMDCVQENWQTYANGSPRPYYDASGLSEVDKYDKVSYVRLYAGTYKMGDRNGTEVPGWFIVDSNNIKTVGQSGSIPKG